VWWLIFGTASFAATLTSLGPTNFAGRVRAIVVRSDDPSTIWVASATGGLWVSRNAGETWSHADDFLPTLTFSSLVADPNNPDVMYAGSGEIFTFLKEGMWLRAMDRGAGIFKTTDGGATWSQLAEMKDKFYVSRIAVQPLNPFEIVPRPRKTNVVLAATEKGIYRSINGGANWNRVLPAHGADPNITFLDVKFHPSDPDNAVATAHERGIFHSADGGLTWQPASPLPAGLAERRGTRTRIELAPSVSEPGTWFALHMDNGGTPVPLILLRSDKRGRDWTAVTGRAIICDCAQLDNNGRYTGTLWVNPRDPTRILVGGGILCLSTDGGANFTSYPDPHGSLHHDHHVLVTGSVTSTEAVLYNGNDGGVNRLKWDDSPTNKALNNLVIQQFESAAMNPISGVVVGGAQDVGTLRRSADGIWTGLNTNGRNGSDGIFVATDPIDPNFWYFGQTVGQIRRSHNGGEGTDSADVDRIAPGVPDRLESACFNVTPLLLDPTNPNVLYAGCNRLWRTQVVKTPAPTTVAASWSPILTVTNNHLITTMAVAPSSPGVMWVGTMLGTGSNPQNGREAWLTKNLQFDSPRFDPVNFSGLPLRPISRIAVHPTDASITYVSLTGWAANDSQNLWRCSLTPVFPGAEIRAVCRDISTGLPPGPIHAVTLHPSVPNWIYAGTDAGLYVSHDDGVSWSAITRGPARVHISDLTWVDNHRLIIATYGRGIFVLDESPNPEHVIVERQSYLAGAQRSGHLENLLESDDTRQVSGNSSDRISMELTGRTGLSRAGVTLVQFTIKSSATSLHFASQMTIELFNFVTGEYGEVSNQTVGTTDLTIQGGVAGAVARELINAKGELRARVTWWGGGLTSSAIDLAHWTIDRP
jgi:photosystem II stability/assembly factor-like uncharacterized protein